MESLAGLTFWEIFFIALKAITAWLLATISSVLGILFLTGIGAIALIACGYLSAFFRAKGEK